MQYYHTCVRICNITSNLWCEFVQTEPSNRYAKQETITTETTILPLYTKETNIITYYRSYKNMKVRVYFCREIDPEIIFKRNKIGRQALDTIYDLVWECEFKNILNVGRVWLKFREEESPFGIPIKEKRSHSRIIQGDIIQIANDFYMVNQIGARQIEVTL